MPVAFHAKEKIERYPFVRRAIHSAARSRAGRAMRQVGGSELLTELVIALKDECASARIIPAKEARRIFKDLE